MHRQRRHCRKHVLLRLTLTLYILIHTPQVRRKHKWPVYIYTLRASGRVLAAKKFGGLRSNRPVFAAWPRERCCKVRGTSGPVGSTEAVGHRTPSAAERNADESRHRHPLFRLCGLIGEGVALMRRRFWVRVPAQAFWETRLFGMPQSRPGKKNAAEIGSQKYCEQGACSKT